MNSKPSVERVDPALAIPGGEVVIRGRDLHGANGAVPQVIFGDSPATIVFATREKIVTRVPESAGDQAVRVRTETGSASELSFQIGIPIVDGIHPVTNPAIDAEGNIFTTFSGARGQAVPVSVYQVDRDYRSKAYLRGILNATGLAFGPDGDLFVSNRHEGVVQRADGQGGLTTYAEGMGIATGIAFDASGSLFVGDRSGTIFKVGTDGQIFVFATLEPSVSAYHLAFGPDGLLYVAGPTTTSFDAIHRINIHGEVETFYRGLGRPQGLAFDTEGNLFVAASLHGQRGIVRVSPQGTAELVVAGHNLVGLAIAPDRRMILATNNGLFQLRWISDPLPLPPPPSA